MKLIDILIENNIQWPEGAEGAVQDPDGEIKFFAGEEPTMDEIWLRDVEISHLIVDEVATDYDTAIITKQEWERRKMSKVKKAMFADVKVGDKVWDIRQGWGVVIDLGYLTDIDYPVTVDFKHDSDHYTLEGRLCAGDLYPSLFWDEIEIKAPPKPLPKLEVDTKVLVWEDGGSEIKRHFSHFNEDGKICVFYNGKTSFTNDSDTPGRENCWDNWKLAE